MIRIDIKRTQLYNEFSPGVAEKHFGNKRSQFLHNIDTLYYGVFFKNDSNDNFVLDTFFTELDDLKVLVKTKDRKVKDDITYQDLVVRLGSYAMVYNYRLSEPDLFDIFISDYLPNINTPRVVVQLRSYGLWVYGVEDLIKKSYEAVLKLFESFDMKILRTVENRIDYAYHTNSIQNPYKFFSDKNLDRYLKTTLTKYYKIGDIRKSGFTLDYFALGQLKSNNIFNRNYNKVKEVIELNYKAFFFDIWHKNGLITEYDKYCFEYAYLKKSYYAIDEARLLFYLEYGNDIRSKKEIQLLLQNETTRHEDIKLLADILTPATTIILNIEFQTKRKFYYYADSQIELLSCYTELDHDPLKRLFKIIDNRQIFLDYLTSTTVAFVNEKGNYLDFWKRLRSLKLDNIHKVCNKYSRDYSTNIDLQKQLSRTLNTIATTSLYRNNIDGNFMDDISDLLCTLNDNDVIYDLAFYDKKTGVIFDNDNIIKDISEKYTDYKQKKYKAIRNRLSPQSVKNTEI